MKQSHHIGNSSLEHSLTCKNHNQIHRWLTGWWWMIGWWWWLVGYQNLEFVKVTQASKFCCSWAFIGHITFFKNSNNFCSNNCNGWHATINFQNRTTIEILKLLWNPLKVFWNFLETPFKLLWNTIDTSWKPLDPLIDPETLLKCPRNLPEAPLKSP